MSKREALLALVAFFLTTGESRAKTIKCDFTEPFRDVFYNPEKETLTMHDEHGTKTAKVVAKPLSANSVQLTAPTLGLNKLILRRDLARRPDRT